LELPGLLMRGVVTTPAAELAHLDAIRRVPPGLVGLVIPSLALFASHRHRDADISASHLLPRSVPEVVVTEEKPRAEARG
jgi:hypothetical protein